MTLYLLSESPVKVAVCEKIAQFLNSKGNSEYSIQTYKVNGGVEQPFNQTTYGASEYRINSFLENNDVTDNDMVISFENGIKVDNDMVCDFCVMTVYFDNNKTSFTSFGIEIDMNLFSEYLTQCHIDLESGSADTTFGSFISSKVDGLSSNNWMQDIRFGNVDRTEQLMSCVYQFYLNRFARYIPDYPREGVLFKDITPIVSDKNLLNYLFRELERVVKYNYSDVDYFAGLDARGFYFAPTLSQIFGKGFIPIRKASKLPKTDQVITESYETEYSEDQFGLIPDENYQGKNVLIIDDLLATGGSIDGAQKVLTNAGLNVLGAVTVYDVESLRNVEKPVKTFSLVRPNICVSDQNVVMDVKKVDYPVPMLVLKSIQETEPMVRQFTLSDAEWFDDTFDNLDKFRIKVLYTEKDRDLAQTILRKIGLDAGTVVKAGQFSNGESHAFIGENVRNCHVFIVSRIRTGHINDDLMELYLILDACNRSSVEKKTVILPYFPYSRSDKKDSPRTHIGAAVQADFLTKLGVDNLVSVDLHAGQIQGYVPKGFHNLYFKKYIAEYIYGNYLRHFPKEEWNDRFIFIAPDAGSTKAIKSYSQMFEVNNIAMDKSRNYKAAEDGQSSILETRFIGRPEEFDGKIGLIIDDMADTMGTMCASIDTLVRNGLDSAIVFVTHGVLSGPALDRINDNPNIREVVVSDTLPQNENVKLSPKLRVISIGELIGRTIDGIMTGRSISRLF